MLAARRPDDRRQPLPRSRTPLVGREQEVAAIAALLTNDRLLLVTLTGPGGVGKTRLALEVAASADHRDGAAFVPLASLTDPQLVVPTIAQAIGIQGPADQPALGWLRDSLHEREMLLVLDNFEHVVAAAPDVSALLDACPNLQVIVTSRVPLRISGEQEYPVAPLALPSTGSAQPASAIQGSAAVDLFVTRARATRPDFALTQTNSPIVADVCRRLDGLPLALELAAARLKVLSPSGLLASLSSRLTILTDGARDAPARHQTIRNAIAWSYDLLNPSEQALFRQLSVFAGGWTLESAQAVAVVDGSTLDALTALIDHSLVRRIAGDTVEPRFEMLETIREFAHEQLVAHRETAGAQRRHAEYFVMLAEAEQPRQMMSERLASMERLESEHDNLRAVLRWSLSDGQVADGMRLGAAIGEFWQRYGHVQEGRDWIEQLLEAGQDAPPELRFELLFRATGLAEIQSDYARLQELLFAQQSEALLIGDPLTIARATFHAAAIIANVEKDYAKAANLGEVAVAHCRAIDEPWWLGRALTHMGTCLNETGETDRATTALDEALGLFQQLGDEWWIAATLDSLGHVARKLGDYPRAMSRYQESLRLAWNQVDPVTVQWELIGIAQTLLASGDTTWAVQLIGVAQAIAVEYAVAELPRGYDQTVAEARAALGETVYAAALEAGNALTLAEAIEQALSIEPASLARSAQPAAASIPFGLSPREQDVLRLVAQGLGDAEVAEQLFIARRTVNTHLTAIYTKLNVSSRTAAARIAIEHGLA
jgi:predicted ATPase/DNA-binding CsgD family transcriptional regulator